MAGAVFFAALFVMVGGLEQSGALKIVEELVLGLTQEDLALSSVTILWLTAIGSALVDNIPITVAMIPVIEHLGSQGLNIYPFWWALAFGAGFGGNGTIIGSTANVIVAQVSNRTKEPITSRLWFRRGLPTMLATCAVGTAAFLAVFPLFER